jgi:hypothetical protein
MMMTLKLAIPAALIMGGFLVCTTASYGTQEFSKKEGGKACTTCHGKIEGKEAMAKNLNPTGLCYKEKKSLATCPAPAPKK